MRWGACVAGLTIALRLCAAEYLINQALRSAQAQDRIDYAWRAREAFPYDHWFRMFADRQLVAAGFEAPIGDSGDIELIWSRAALRFHARQIDDARKLLLAAQARAPHNATIARTLGILDSVAARPDPR